MQIFLDTANVEEIRKAARLGLLSGVTTNPSLMAKEKGASYKSTVQEVCYIVRGHVSAEVLSLEAEAMVEEARVIAAWSPHVAVKVPVTAEGLAAISAMSSMQVDEGRLCSGCPHQDDCPMGGPEERRALVRGRGIRTNATLVFSANQALLAGRAGATYVSPFVGRLDDIGHDGMELVGDIVKIFRTYGIKTLVLAASIRHPQHLTRAALLGADICTVPYPVLIQATKHALTDVGIDRFLADWKRAQGG